MCLVWLFCCLILFLLFVLGFVCLLSSIFSFFLFFLLLLFFPFFSYLTFLWPCCTVCRLLVPWPGVGPWHQGWVHQVQNAGPPENSWAQGILISICSHRGIHLDPHTHLHPTGCRFQYWTPHVKQTARQEHRPTHQQKGYLNSY